MKQQITYKVKYRQTCTKSGDKAIYLLQKGYKLLYMTYLPNVPNSQCYTFRKHRL